MVEKGFGGRGSVAFVVWGIYREPSSSGTMFSFHILLYLESFVKVDVTERVSQDHV